MKIKKIQIIYGFLFLWILFNNYFQTIIPVFSYFDEGIVLFSIIYMLINVKACMKGIRFHILVATAIIVLIGLAGDCAFHYNANTIVVIKDIVAFIKGPLAIIAFSFYHKKHRTECALKVAYVLSKIIIVIMSVFYVVSQFADTGMLYDVRRGIASYKFIYSHPTFFVYSLVIMLSCLVAMGINKKNFIYQILGIVLLILSMRDKAFAFVVLYFAVIVIFPNRDKIKIRYIVLTAVAILFVVRDKLSLYASFSWSPRYAMYSTGIRLIKDCFPLGSGLGTFASILSGEYYSKLYSVYGMHNRFGTSAEDYIDLGDAGLPYYYGQFGIIGFILFGLILYYLYQLIRKLYFSDKNKRMASILIVGYSMIALIVENFFVNETGATVFIVLFIFLGHAMNEHQKSGNNKRTYTLHMKG